MSPIHLPLLQARSRLALVAVDGVQHDLVRVVCSVRGITFTPVIADGVSEDGTVFVEGAGGNGAADGGVALEPVLGNSVPEVEGAV